MIFEVMAKSKREAQVEGPVGFLGVIAALMETATGSDLVIEFIE
jgi:hypothetical protein